MNDENLKRDREQRENGKEQERIENKDVKRGHH